jgi:type II secretory pathway component GspD/PulD (secretin)
MRKTVSLIFTLAVLISFLSHYPMIASAPSHAASIAPDLFGSAERVKELGQSNWYQSFAPEPVPTVKKAAAVKAADTAKAANSSQPVAAPEQAVALHSDIDSRSLAQLTAIHDADLRFLKREKVRDQQGNYCDPKFVGETLTFSQSVGSTLDELLNQIHNRFGINFVLGPKVGRLPINVKSEDTPWTTILRSQLFVLGVGATCVDSRTIQLIKNDDVTALEKAEHESAKVETHYIKLKYLQPSSSENKNIAGQSSSSSSSSGGQGGAGGSGGCQQNQGGAGGGGGGQQQNIPQRCKFERLMIEIGQILGISGNQGGVNTYAQGPNQPNGQEPIYTGGYGSPYKPYVGQVPGRNMLVVRGTKRQLDEVNELIKHADIPPFQVVIRGLVYTANEDKLRDIGVQTTITARTGDNRTSGGIFGQSVGGLGTLFDFSTVVGTVDFNVQANALQQNGVISIKSRPFATVLDGITTDLTVGRQVPVIIQAANNLGGAPGTLQILQAANLLSVTPHVIDDDQGNPTAVNLELQLESNDVDTSVLSQGVPAVSVRSIQSNFILNQEQTAILGGFTVDSDNKTVTKTPGLGDIPILGELFKRRVRSNQINRLYFAISVSVIPYGGVIEPVTVPGATTAPPSITPKMEERGKEPKAVVPPKGP